MYVVSRFFSLFFKKTTDPSLPPLTLTCSSPLFCKSARQSDMASNSLGVKSTSFSELAYKQSGIGWRNVHSNQRGKSKNALLPPSTDPKERSG